MPPYAWLLTRRVDPGDVGASMRALRRAGVAYSEADLAGAPQSLATQGAAIVANLAAAGIEVEADREIVALIAYLQRLGQDGNRVLRNGAGGGR